MEHVRKKRVAWIAWLLAISIILAGCGSSGETEKEKGEETKAAAGTEEPAKDVEGAAKDTLTIALKNEPPSLDPYNINDQTSSAVRVQMLESLFEMDVDGTISNLLAESYEFVDDITLRITLKKGVKFHNGDELKANDAVFSLKSAAESSLITQYSGMIDPNGFEIEDNYTFTMKTTMPFSPIFNALATPANAIVSEKVYQEMGDGFAREPVGTGPYCLESWDTGDKLVLKRFSDYHGEAAKTEHLVFRFITEASSRLIELESGGVDIALDLSNSDLELVRENNELELYETPGYQLIYVAMNEQREWFQDINVRKAMLHAADTQAIVDIVYQGLTSPSKTVLPETILGAREDLEPYTYDVELAKEYMAKSAYPDGFSCNIVVNEDVSRTRIAEMLQAYWGEIGINVEVKQLEQSSFMSALNTLEGLDTCVGGYNNVMAHADTTLFRLFYSENLASGGNYSAYANDQVDKLLMEARGLPTWEEQEGKYSELQEIIWEDAVILPVTAPLVTLAANKNVTGIVIRPDMYQRYSTVSVK